MTAILRHRITPAEFVNKWRPVTLTERAAAHSHFNDVCDLLDHPRPLDVDPRGEWFTFEKGVKKAGGGDGFADVWKREGFAWEYKKKKRNLDSALEQLSRYALALENPPLHIACDTDRFRIVTAYTNSVAKSYDLTLDELLNVEKRGWLETAFHEPTKLKPGAKRSDLTKQAADKFSTLAQRLQTKGHAPEDVAHFVNRLVFLFFAEDVRLLKDGFFRRTVAELAGRPSDAQDLLTGLFRTFQTGGRFGLDRLPWINGGLFDHREALPLDEHEVGLIKAASSQNWSHIDPTIFGTLFERFLDPDKRAQIGAHYTDAAKIEQIVEPVILRPLREEWRAARADIEALVKKASAKGAKSKDWQRAEERRSAFLERLRTLSILDPACGSGNFLYLALHGVKDLEHAANQECETLGLEPKWPSVGPEILHGIEINPVAADLARTTIWIGDIQWGVQNGFNTRPEPILRKLDLIENRDALLKEDGTKSDWPAADFIVGNPPFLGSKFHRKGRPANKRSVAVKGLGDDYVDRLYDAYKGHVPASADLVSYWFGKLLPYCKSSRMLRAGFIATKSICKGASNEPLSKILGCTDFCISNAYTNEEWIVDGAAVRVSVICIARNPNFVELNNTIVTSINTDLTTGIDLSSADELQENKKTVFQGVKTNGPFDIDGHTARTFIRQPVNVKGRYNSEIIRRFVTNDDITMRDKDRWIVDFSEYQNLSEACLFEKPFAHIKSKVPEFRSKLEVGSATEHGRLDKFWLMQRSRPKLRKSASQFDRIMCVPETSEHLLFRFFPSQYVFSGSLFAICRDDYVTFGILCSKVHRAWARGQGNKMGVGNQGRYNASRAFETFPFPEGLTPDLLAASYADDSRAVTITEAAAELDRLREAWLNPSDLVRVEPEVVLGYPDRVLPRDAAAAAELKKRTLTNLYNDRPTWLDNAHRELDAAVAAAYGWPEDISTEDALAALLDLNRERAAAQGRV